MSLYKLNLNPKNKKTGDCVIRAIAYATKQDWDVVYKDLCDLGFKMKMMPNDKRVFSKYLEQQGWNKCKQPRKRDNTKYTLDEATEIDQSLKIVSVARHLTVIHKGNIIDTWDCGNKCVGNYWVKEV